jgi:hypothetical protein
MRPADDIKKLIRQSHVTTDPQADDRILADALADLGRLRQERSAAVLPNFWRMITKNRMIRAVAVSVLGIALLIPVGYGAATIIRKLVVESETVDSFEGRFELNKNISFGKHQHPLQVGTTGERARVMAGNIRFFEEGDRLLGTLRTRVRIWPKFKWRTKIALLTADGKLLRSTEHVNESAGATLPDKRELLGRDVHFSLGRRNDTLYYQAENFKVTIELVPQRTETTPDAWLVSKELPQVYGYVVGPNDTPIANAVIRVRGEDITDEQLATLSPALRTNEPHFHDEVMADEEGYYSYDGISRPYTVRALIYEKSPCGQQMLHQYKRLHTVFEGTQQVDFKFPEFPKGNAILSIEAVDPNGQRFKEIGINLRNQVDWKDYSTEYLYQYGIQGPFSTADGRLEIPGLAPGDYRLIMGAGKHRWDIKCELVDGQRTDIAVKGEPEKLWYGRVLFDDGNPAVLDATGKKTQIIKWERGRWEGGVSPGETIAIVDSEGYFNVSLSDETIEQMKEGKIFLTISLSDMQSVHSLQKEEYPVELLALSRDDTGAVEIGRPRLYHGRILYENGKPALSAGVVLRYIEATADDGGLTEGLGGVDELGYFSAYLADEQVERLRAGEYWLDIYHPSPEDERVSAPIGRFPPEMLSKELKNTQTYKLPYEEMGGEFCDLRQIHESADKLRQLGSLLLAYWHNGQFPASLQELESMNAGELFTWATENLVYRPGAGAALAYDKTLLKKTAGTNVLFVNGDVDFCMGRRLRALGIHKQ